MNQLAHRRLVRASAIYDMLMTTGFALPIIAGLKIQLLQNIHHAVGFSGVLPDLDATAMLFVNLVGSIVSVWALLRIINPLAVFNVYDAVGRLLFSLAMANALFIGVDLVVVAA